MMQMSSLVKYVSTLSLSLVSEILLLSMYSSVSYACVLRRSIIPGSFVDTQVQTKMRS
jgi:hypothetical protein